MIETDWRTWPTTEKQQLLHRLMERRSERMRGGDRHPVDMSLGDYMQAWLGQAYRPGRHLDVMYDHLAAVDAGQVDRLMILMPPGHAKSRTVAGWVARGLGERPDNRVIVASYADNLAFRTSRWVRDQIGAPFWPYDASVRYGEASVRQWAIAGQQGGLYAAGIGGGMTGHRADLLVIDDPVKDRQAADSPTWRERTWEWYDEVATTRLKPRAAIVLVMTHWHQDDLAGRIQEQESGEWVIVRLPARMDYDDEVPEYEWRAEGDWLWPEYFPPHYYERIMRNRSTRAWNALYQQRPHAVEGGVFQRSWFGNRYDSLGDLAPGRVIQTVDSAFTASVGHSYSVIATWAEVESGYAVLDIWRDRVEFPELMDALRDQHAKWPMSRMYIEDKASGRSAIQQLAREGIHAEAFTPVGSKEARADEVTPPMRDGMVWLPREAPWVSGWVDEHVEAWTGANDDQIDTTSMALKILWAPSIRGSKHVPVPAGVALVGGVNTGRYRGGE